MRRAAPKRLPKPTRKMRCIGLRYSPRVNEDLYARPSNLGSSQKGPAIQPGCQPEQREEESG